MRMRLYESKVNVFTSDVVVRSRVLGSNASGRDLLVHVRLPIIERGTSHLSLRITHSQHTWMNSITTHSETQRTSAPKTLAAALATSALTMRARSVPALTNLERAAASFCSAYIQYQYEQAVRWSVGAACQITKLRVYDSVCVNRKPVYVSLPR